MGERPLAFVVVGNEVSAQRLEITVSQIRRLFRALQLNLRSAVRQPSGGATHLITNAKGLLQRLHTVLLAPISEALGPQRRLMIVPHGILHYLPFHALYDGSQYLVESHEVSYLPGSSLLRYLVSARDRAQGALVLGHSYGERLGSAVREAHAVAEVLGTSERVESEATVSAFRQAAPDAGVIHVAAHGEFRDDNPLFSGIALDDGWLTTLDVFGLRLRASLVTLSGCRTGQSVVSGGDELLGLMRAFLYAGADSLVMSLWPVEDRATARFMDAFYRLLAAGWTKTSALRQVQTRFLQGDVDGIPHPTGHLAHPYYWAPFFLVGATGPL
jgi:CHAT domain-containing protein